MVFYHLRSVVILRYTGHGIECTARLHFLLRELRRLRALELETFDSINKLESN